MTKVKERCSLKFLIEAIPDVDVLTVKGTASLGAEVEKCRVVLKATGERQGKLARLKELAIHFNGLKGIWGD